MHLLNFFIKRKMFVFLFFNHYIVTNSKNTETPVINTDASVQKKQNKHYIYINHEKTWGIFMVHQGGVEPP